MRVASAGTVGGCGRIFESVRCPRLLRPHPPDDREVCKAEGNCERQHTACQVTEGSKSSRLTEVQRPEAIEEKQAAAAMKIKMV